MSNKQLTFLRRINEERLLDYLTAYCFRKSQVYQSIATDLDVFVNLSKQPINPESESVLEKTAEKIAVELREAEDDFLKDAVMRLEKTYPETYKKYLRPKLPIV